MKGYKAMAMTKKIQKVFYYSNEYVKKFIESRIDDMTIITKRSSSFIIENLLLDGLLPQNEDAKSIIRTNLYPDNEQGSVQETLDAVFSYNAAGINWKSKYSNFKPLVEYCINFSSATSTCKGTEGHRHYLISQLTDIVDRIENCTYSCIEPYERKMYSSQLERAKILLNTTKEKPEELIFRNHFQLVYDCWDMLDDWSITYRYLCCLAVMCNFQENPTTRNYLYDLISEISKEW